MNIKLVNIMGSAKKLGGIILPIVLFIVLSGSFIKGIQRSKDTQKLIQATKDKLETAKEDNERLKNQMEFVQSEQFLEEQLRDKLGLAKEGEIILVLPEDDILRKLAPVIPEEEEFKPLPNWKKWVNLFI